ncbi:hypothetical protein DSM3645_27917 [Blastopirellula marina DSM 3645]|uniref:Uncharacterized protein n=1 Tax=Blastopirellula marina DSM 3645 TaxID=314230 RepID=A3ZP09_9BACT|nr:hypothetical protein [Blastopirellula marina]EAQ81483.1 hypothetical protein DSM3645_27917 [Blastopirellula marina DSM 3645]
MPLKIRRVAFQFPKLASLPAIFFSIERTVENKAMGVKLRIRNTIDRTRGGVNELRPDHVACRTVLIFANTGFHLRFHFPHRFTRRLLKCSQDGLILVEPIK